MSRSPDIDPHTPTVVLQVSTTIRPMSPLDGRGLEVLDIAGSSRLAREAVRGDDAPVSRGGLEALFEAWGTRTQVMGVLNVTPDSFSDGGRYADVDRGLTHAETIRTAGADIIDVGGETTRPGSEPVPLDEELARVLPIIEALMTRGLGPVSIDTTKAEVARRAVECGAALVNDISAMRFDPAMPETVASLGVPVVLMHTRAPPKVMQEGAWMYEGGVVESVYASLSAAVEKAVDAGVSRDRIVVDPGFGFGKTVEENLELLRGLRRFRDTGCPILVGTSRKSFLGQLSGRAVDARVMATAASVAVAIQNGADIVRVHDVEEMRDVVRVTDAIVRGRPEEVET